MDINRNNYEQYCLDYIEGKLSASDRDSFQLFLCENPQIMDELNEMKSALLQPDPILFSDKEYLKKGMEIKLPVNRYNFDDFCIAYVENNLSEIQKNELQKFIVANPEKAQDFELFNKVRFYPVKGITYQYKRQLKKHTVATISLTRFLTAAASTAAILVLAMLLFRSTGREINRSPVVALTANKDHQIPKIKTKVQKNKTEKTVAVMALQHPNLRDLTRTTDRVNRFSSNTVLISDNDRNLNGLQLIHGRSSLFLLTVNDNLNMNPLIAELKAVPVINDDQSSVLWVFVRTTFNKINQLTGNHVKYYQKRDKSRNIISFETPLIGFYRSKYEH